ncbi:MAG: hypothetical protein WCF16_12530, partial [Alphaproteobacteria bacterium]
RGRQRRAAELSARIDGGRAGRADIEDAFAQGQFGPSERDALLQTLEGRRAKDAQAAGDIARVGAVLRGEAPPLDPNDPADRRAADTYYAEVLIPALSGGPGAAGTGNAPAAAGPASDAPALIAKRTAEFATRTGVVPAAALTRARAELSFGTPDQQTAAARVIAAIPANLRAQVGADAAARASLLTRALDAGLPPELVSRAADNAMRQRAQEAQQRGSFAAQNGADQTSATYTDTTGQTSRTGNTGQRTLAGDVEQQPVENRGASADTITRAHQSGYSGETAAPRVHESIEDVIGRVDVHKSVFAEMRKPEDKKKAKDEAERYLSNPDPNTVLSMKESRIWAIRNRLPAKFNITDAPWKKGEAPFYGDVAAAEKAIRENDGLIAKEAKAQNVDPNLVKAIIFFENRNGQYFGLAPIGDITGLSTSYFPMNINSGIWDGLGGVKQKDFSDPKKNIRAGVALIRAIIDRLDPNDQTPAKIGSIWHRSGAEEVDDAGAQIQRIFDERPWEGARSGHNRR